MSVYLLGVAVFVLATVAVGLARILRGPGDADRIMAAELLGTGGVAALLLLGSVSGDGAVVNVALTLALLAAFASVVFYKGVTGELGDKASDGAGEGAGQAIDAAGAGAGDRGPRA